VVVGLENNEMEYAFGLFPSFNQPLGESIVGDNHGQKNLQNQEKKNENEMS